VFQGGPTGAPVSEDIFIQVMQSYAQEATVDTIVNGVMATIEATRPPPTPLGDQGYPGRAPGGEGGVHPRGRPYLGI
jgi:methylamine--corrinoid protein Co-methyltransferase